MIWEIVEALPKNVLLHEIYKKTDKYVENQLWIWTH